MRAPNMPMLDAGLPLTMTHEIGERKYRVKGKPRGRVAPEVQNRGGKNQRTKHDFQQLVLLVLLVQPSGGWFKGKFGLPVIGPALAVLVLVSRVLLDLSDLGLPGLLVLLCCWVATSLSGKPHAGDAVES